MRTECERPAQGDERTRYCLCSRLNRLSPLPAGFRLHFNTSSPWISVMRDRSWLNLKVLVPAVKSKSPQHIVWLQLCAVLRFKRVSHRQTTICHTFACAAHQPHPQSWRHGAWPYGDGIPQGLLRCNRTGGKRATSGYSCTESCTSSKSICKPEHIPAFSMHCLSAHTGVHLTPAVVCDDQGIGVNSGKLVYLRAHSSSHRMRRNTCQGHAAARVLADGLHRKASCFPTCPAGNAVFCCTCNNPVCCPAPPRRSRGRLLQGQTDSAAYPRCRPWGESDPR